MAFCALHVLHWDLEFVQQTGAQGLAQQSPLADSRMQGSLFSRVGSIRMMKSKSKASVDSEAYTCGAHSTASGGTELADHQEQAQVLQTRIELQTKYCQRRPFKLKRYYRGKDKPTTSAKEFQLATFGFGEGSFSRIGEQQQGFNFEEACQTSYVFALARAELARPKLKPPQPVSVFPA